VWFWLDRTRCNRAPAGANHNSEKHIAGCLQSVAGQAFKNIEHIVVDGGSTDNTVEIVKSFPSVTKWISDANKG